MFFSDTRNELREFRLSSEMMGTKGVELMRGIVAAAFQLDSCHGEWK
jgi:hypothetical protein